MADAPDNRRQKYLLGILVVVLLFSAYQRLPSLGGGDVFGGSSGVGAGLEQQRGAPEIVELRTRLLAREAGQFENSRNPWSFSQPPREPSEQPVPQPRPEIRQLPRNDAPVVETPPDDQPPAALPPAIDVSYIGSFGSRSRPIAVFADDEAIYNAFEGDVVKGKFEVYEIGYESVDIKYVGFPDVAPERLPIGGGR